MKRDGRQVLTEWLVLRAQGGDESAFRELYALWSADLRRMARVRVEEEGAAEEVARQGRGVEPDVELRRLYRENLWLRDLALRVAHDLERISALERYASHTKPLLRRATRIRRRLHEGPGDWTPER